MTTSAQAERLNAAVDVMLRELNQGLPNGEYTIAWQPDRRDLAFSISYKSRNNSRDRKTYQGITRRQAMVIEQTSHTIQEIADRMKLLIIDGKDTTKYDQPAPTGVDPALLDKIVTERLDAYLKQHSPKPEAEGVQRKRYLKDDGKLQAYKDEVELWTRRAKLLNMAGPILTKSKTVDKRWLIAAMARWNAHTTAHGDPEEGQTEE